jgi:hypothetical protein
VRIRRVELDEEEGRKEEGEERSGRVRVKLNVIESTWRFGWLESFLRIVSFSENRPSYAPTMRS